MKTKLTITTALVLFILTAGFFSCGNKAGGSDYAAGTAVAAKWSDGNYWTAKIVSLSGDKYKITYDDGTSGEVMKADIKPLAAKEDLKAGDAVWAVWSGNAKMYKGTIQDIQEGGVNVKWNDGSAASLVPFGKIAK